MRLSKCKPSTDPEYLWKRKGSDALKRKSKILSLFSGELAGVGCVADRWLVALALNLLYFPIKRHSFRENFFSKFFFQNFGILWEHFQRIFFRSIRFPNTGMCFEYLVDPASADMLMSKIKPCMSKNAVYGFSVYSSLQQYYLPRLILPRILSIILESIPCPYGEIRSPACSAVCVP